jgi:hypothetical protein
MPFHVKLIFIQLLLINALQFKLLLKLILPFDFLNVFDFSLLLELRELFFSQLQFKRLFN